MSSVPGAQIECPRGCRPAQTVHAAVPARSKPMTTQTRMFNLLRMGAAHSRGLLNSIHSLQHSVGDIPRQRRVV